MASRYFEDFSAGDEWSFEPWELSEDDIVAFATRYDPQVMHTDPESAAEGPHGGVIASGWQTALNTIAPFLGGVMRDAASLASPGLDNFRWRRPVLVGDRITPRIRVLETRRSESKPDRGIVKFEFNALGDDGDPVWEAVAIFFILCRTPG